MRKFIIAAIAAGKIVVVLIAGIVMLVKNVKGKIMTDKEKYISFLQSIGFTEMENANPYDIDDFYISPNKYVIVFDKVYIRQYNDESACNSWFLFNSLGTFLVNGYD